MTVREFYRNKGNELGALRQAIIDNTRGDLFWIGEILLSELEKETGFTGRDDGEKDDRR